MPGVLLFPAEQFFPAFPSFPCLAFLGLSKNNLGEARFPDSGRITSEAGGPIRTGQGKDVRGGVSESPASGVSGASGALGALREEESPFGIGIPKGFFVCLLRLPFLRLARAQMDLDCLGTEHGAKAQMALNPHCYQGESFPPSPVIARRLQRISMFLATANHLEANCHRSPCARHQKRRFAIRADHNFSQETSSSSVGMREMSWMWPAQVRGCSSVELWGLSPEGAFGWSNIVGSRPKVGAPTRKRTAPHRVFEASLVVPG